MTNLPVRTVSAAPTRRLSPAAAWRLWCILTALYGVLTALRRSVPRRRLVAQLMLLAATLMLSSCSDGPKDPCAPPVDFAHCAEPQMRPAAGVGKPTHKHAFGDCDSRDLANFTCE